MPILPVKKIVQNIKKMSCVSQELDKLDIPYKNLALLFGQPGTGKTMFARYLALKMKLPFCYVTFANVIDSSLGGTAKNIHQLFSFVRQFPCVFLMDEVDYIATDRKRVTGSSTGREEANITLTLLQELDTLPNQCVVLAATNHEKLLDSAFLSRCSAKYEFTAFSKEENKKMVECFLSDVHMKITASDMEMLLERNNQREIINNLIKIIADQIIKNKEEATCSL